MIARGKNVTGESYIAQFSQLQTSFLEYFATRRTGRRFTGQNPAAGQLPFEIPCTAGAATEQHHRVVGYDHRNGAANPHLSGIDYPAPRLAP